ncbi:FAD-dependent thymidylate synthase [Paenibacillus sp. FSL E2-0178]|uniref:FAD-dependent thymidylate synthase n=1 Tax=Paenibacillus sp. FSL E2-0178 TaxID=2921361 RepID=UPI003159727B
MNVQLIAYTQLSDSFKKQIQSDIQFEYNERAAIALTAIRTCYSPNPPSEILSLEGNKYFGNKATDGKSGTEADRLFRHITGSGHSSTLEHLNYTFAIEGVSRALMGQLTRHRHLSFSIQSQRYVRFGSEDRSGGFAYVTPPSVEKNKDVVVNYNDFGDTETVGEIYETLMKRLQSGYDDLRKGGVTAEDCRSILPNAATTNIVLTGNLRTLLEFYNKRKPGKGAQYEITELAEGIKSKIIEVDEWLTAYFEEK